jgi:hypothetical protein
MGVASSTSHPSPVGTPRRGSVRLYALGEPAESGRSGHAISLLRLWSERPGATKVSAIAKGGNEKSAADEWVGATGPSY